MEANKSTGTGFDTRERLESEIDEWCAEHFNSSFSGGAFNLILEWLDRQAAITEREVMFDMQAAYDKAVDIERGYVEYMRKKRDELQAQVDKLQCEVSRLQGRLDMTETMAGARLGLAKQRAKEVDRLKAENAKLREELETTKHKCDSLQFGMDDATIRRTNEKQENEVLRKRLQDRIDSLQAENACLLHSINSLRNCLLRDWHIETEWSECLKAYVIRLEDGAMGGAGIEVPK